MKTRRGSPVDGRPSTDEAPLIGKINPFSKIAVTLNQLCDFDALQDLESPKKNGKIVYFMTESTIFNH